VMVSSTHTWSFLRCTHHLRTQGMMNDVHNNNGLLLKIL
jgi:hypothetical protein